MHRTKPAVRLDTSLETLLESGAHLERGVLATLVATAGSTYRKPGARMLILADGRIFGLLSGGCLEADLNAHAHEVLDSGRPRAVEYDMRGPDDILFGIGAGCEGAMRILLEPAGRDSLAACSLINAGRATRAGRPTSLVAVHDAAGLPLGTYDAAVLAPAAIAGRGPPLEPCAPALAAAARRALQEAESCQLEFAEAGRRGRAFVEFLAPPPHLLICGGGPDAQPVVASALALGWRVTVVDHRPAYAAAARFPGAAVRRADAGDLQAAVPIGECHAAVVMSHHLASDTAYLRALADAGAPEYVGLLGPAARRQRIAQELGDRMAALRRRIRGPVGMDIGAVTPEGIGLAIVCQIHAWLAGRELA
jgi:xanthine/CO dehydrogenase XdhC/CoxF family maturation factor